MASRLQWRRDRGTDVALRVVDLLVKRGDVALDIGALRGDYSMRMLDLVGSAGSVHAFEPNPTHHDRLRALASRGRRVHVHPVALSDRNGAAVLHVPVAGDSSAGLATLEDHPGLEARELTVPVRRLDEVLGTDTRVSFVKCDVEGHEDAVLDGAHDLLERDRPTLLLEIEQRHRRSDVSVAFEHCASLGYEGWALFPGGLRPLSAFDLERDQRKWLPDAAPNGVMPRGYVHNFVFARPGIDLRSLDDPAVARGEAASPSRTRA
jgi:FkbM family methyltransferase